MLDEERSEEAEGECEGRSKTLPDKSDCTDGVRDDLVAGQFRQNRVVPGLNEAAPKTTIGGSDMTAENDVHNADVTNRYSEACDADAEAPATDSASASDAGLPPIIGTARRMPDGQYIAEITSVGPAKTSRGDSARFEVKIVESCAYYGAVASGLASCSGGPLSRIYRWCEAALGRELAIGEEFHPEDACGAQVRVTIENREREDGRVFANVVEMEKM